MVAGMVKIERIQKCSTRTQLGEKCHEVILQSRVVTRVVLAGGLSYKLVTICVVMPDLEAVENRDKKEGFRR